MARVRRNRMSVLRVVILGLLALVLIIYGVNFTHFSLHPDMNDHQNNMDLIRNLESMMQNLIKNELALDNSGLNHIVGLLKDGDANTFMKAINETKAQKQNI